MRTTAATATLPLALLASIGININTVPVTAEIRTYSENTYFVPGDTISYTQGYISAPGYLDVSGLRFRQVDVYTNTINNNNHAGLLLRLRRVLEDDEDIMNAAFAMMMQIMTGDMSGIGEYVDDIWDMILGNNTVAAMIDGGIAEVVNIGTIGELYEQSIDEVLAAAGGLTLGEYTEQIVDLSTQMFPAFDMEDVISDFVGNSTVHGHIDSIVDEYLEEYNGSISMFVDAMIHNVTEDATLGEFVEDMLDEAIGNGTVGSFVEELLVNATEMLGVDAFNNFGSIIGQLMGNATEVAGDIFGFGGIDAGYDDEDENGMEEEVDDEAVAVMISSGDDNDDEQQDEEEPYEYSPSDDENIHETHGTNQNDTSNVDNVNGSHGSKNKGSHNDDTVIIEIVFVPEEAYDCAGSKDGCELPELGIGLRVSSDDGEDGGGYEWCCSEEAITLGWCAPSMRGKLIIDNIKLKGTYLSVYIPRFDVGKPGGSAAIMKTNVSGKQSMFIANCGDKDVTMSGTVGWKSKHGYLPGYLWGEFVLFAVLTILYASLLTWYSYKMNKFGEHNIDIHKWLVFTILIGTLEVFFKAGDFWVWNEDGVRFESITYTGLLLGIMKRAISRGLILMVSLGWGVVRDTLGDKLRKIRLFCIVYITIAACQDVFYTLSITADPTLTNSLTEEEENAFKDAASIFRLFTVLLDVFIYVWIFDALKATIQHLETMSQYQKLNIMLNLRNIIYISIAFAILWSLFGFLNSATTPNILNMDQVWALNGAWEVNYFFLLFCVAILWRPNERSKEFAYAMQLPSQDDINDIEFEHTTESNELPDDDELRWGPDHGKDDYELEGSLDGFAMVKTGLDVEDGEIA